ncbi:MAG: hypothetical protein LJE68_13275 [Rhodobacter sp.]|nr:hypothetical protein [Rhodobacter sp.]
MAASSVTAFQQIENQGAGVIPGLGFDRSSGRLSGSVAAGEDIDATIARIGRQAGFEARLQPGLGKTASVVNLDGLTVEAALRRLLRNRSFVIFRGGSDANSEQISRIWVVVEGETFDRDWQPDTPVAVPEPPEPDPDAPDPVITHAIAVRDIIRLSNIADAEAIARLRDLATDAKDPALRRAAISALAGAAGAASFNLFAYWGLRDPDPTVRIEAARSLMRIDRYSAPAILEAAAVRETDTSAREILQRLAAGETVEHVTAISRTRIAN